MLVQTHALTKPILRAALDGSSSESDFISSSCKPVKRSALDACVVHAILFGMIKKKAEGQKTWCLKRTTLSPINMEVKNQPKWQETDIGGTQSPLPRLWEEGYIQIDFTLWKDNQHQPTILPNLQISTSNISNKQKCSQRTCQVCFFSTFLCLQIFWPFRFRPTNWGNIGRSINHTPQKNLVLLTALNHGDGKHLLTAFGDFIRNSPQETLMVTIPMLHTKCLSLLDMFWRLTSPPNFIQLEISLKFHCYT